jgi:uncharacterized protein (TIGR02246 family)
LLSAGLGFVLASTACQPVAQEGPSLSEADVAAIEAFHERFLEAERANDWQAVAALMAEDAVLMPMGHPVLDGPAGYLAYVAPLVEDYGVVVTDFVGTIQEIDGRGDIAYLRTTWSHTVTMDGVPEPVTETGKQLIVLRRQPNGSWLATQWIWTSDGLTEQGGVG